MPEILRNAELSVFRTIPDSYNPSYDEVFSQIGDDISDLGHLKKVHISALAAWKRLNLSSRWAKSLQELPDLTLAEMSRPLFEEEISMTERISRFSTSGIPGFRSGTFAVASTVLAAWRPIDFGITDRRSREALRSLHCGCNNDVNTYTTYLSHLHLIRDQVPGLAYTLRTARHIDSVLFSFGSELMDKVSPRQF